MAAFEKAIETAVSNEEIPGCVLYATNRDGIYTTPFLTHITY